MIAPVNRAIQPAAQSIRRRVDAPRRPSRLPQRCVNRSWISWLERQINRACVFVMKQNFLPTLSAIFRAEHPSLLVRPVRMPQRGDENLVYVSRVHDDSPNLPRIFEPNVRPRFAAVRGLVHSIPVGNRRAHVRLAGAHVNHVRIRWHHRDCSNRSNRLRIENRLPRPPRIIRFPNAAAHTSKIENLRLPAHARYRQRSPSTRWTNEPPPQLLK